jgi:hypothetical protein
MQTKFKINSFAGALVLLTVASVLFFILSLLSEGGLYGGDSYQHYLFAKYAFAHPENYLDHWGKPLFTLLASPFAYFGFHAMMLFNILICAVASYITLLTAHKLNYANLPLVVVFTIFTPVFILLMFSGLTEAVFSLLLIASVYLFIRKNYIPAAILISLIPFVRSEGLMFIAWFLILFLVKRQYKTIPFLLFGVLFYSVLGGLISGNFIWLITDNPYKASESVYGHGSLFQYVTSVPSTFGLVVFLFAIIGFSAICYLYFKQLKHAREGNDIRFNELFVISFSAIGYFVFHSMVWWQGWLSVLGDPRFMAAIVPLISLMALKGLNTAISSVRKPKIQMGMTVLVAGVVMAVGLTRYHLPVRLKGEDETVMLAANWMKAHGYDKNPTIFFNPIIPVLLDKDPFNPNQMRASVSDSNNPDVGVEKNTVIIWDTHFSEFESKVSLSKMLENPNYQLLKMVSPNPPFKIFDNRDFQVAVFIRK